MLTRARKPTKKTQSGSQSKKCLTNRLRRDIIKSLKGKQSPRERKNKNEKDFCYSARDVRRRNPVYSRRLQRSGVRRKWAVLRGGAELLLIYLFLYFCFQVMTFEE